MALSFGFYNSINSDRVYDAIQFGQIFDGIIKDGIYATYEKAMVVIASENAGEVIIQPGRAWFNHTWSYNDANLIIEAPAPDILLERIDALVLDVNTELAFRENSFKWVEGTASSRPERPTLTNTVTHHQYPLCYIHRYPETTMIYTRDITNMVGTSECPFVTGVLTGLDIDMWINQWDDEFHTWETNTRTQFEAWMVNQQEVYTTWFNSVRSEMEDNMTEFEAWFETIRGIIDEEAATHLQAEIDALAAMLPAGSHIDIHTTETTLYNRNVTVSDQAGHSKTVKFSAAGDATVESFPYVGLLDFVSTDGVRTANASITTPYFGRYALTMAFWAATCNLVSDETFAGIVVTVTDSLGDVKGAVTLDSEGSGVFTATYPDTYTFTLTYGGQTMEVSLAVTQETTYEVELHGGFRIDQWLVAGRVEEEFDTLDEILEDEKTLRQLFLVHDSVDYMYDTYHDTQKINEDYAKIFGCDLAAKWINLSDYALNKFYANEGIKAFMDTADKYGYGEWGFVGQVPAMTSATAPYGEVFCDSSESNRPGWWAFDGLPTTNWNSNKTIAQVDSNVYIGYSFSESIRINAFSILIDGADSVIKLQGSNDGEIWTDLSEQIIISSTNKEEIQIAVSSNGYYSKYRVLFVSQTGVGGTASSAKGGRVLSLQFYSWGPKGNVPQMTSNTAPFGEAVKNGEQSNHPAWWAFNDAQTDTWASTSAASGHYLGYHFTNPVNVRKVLIRVNLDPEQTVRVEYSDDGSTWIPTTSVITYSSASGQIFTLNVNDYGYHQYWRVYHVSSPSALYFQLFKLQFYGRELKVSVPTMTSNTAPYGEVSSADVYSSSYAPWRAFDGATGSSNKYIPADGTETKWIQYKFASPICAKEVFISLDTAIATVQARISKFEVIGSNDGTTWSEPLGEISTDSITDASKIHFTLTNAEQYTYLRLNEYKKISNGVGYYTVQFYGLDYSEKEFEVGTTKKWLYDHGVELEELETFRGSSTTSASNRNDSGQVYFAPLAGTNNSVNNFNGIGATISVSEFHLVRCKLGNKIAVVDTYSGCVEVLTEKPVSYSTSARLASLNVNATALLTPYVIGLDIASINGEYFVAVDAILLNGRGISFTELWLE